MRNPDLDARIDDAALALGIDLAADPDDLRIADAVSFSCGADVYSGLALALNIAMLCDDTARARYHEIYGQAWDDLPALVEGVVVARRSPRIAVGTAPGVTVIGTARGRR